MLTQRVKPSPARVQYWVGALFVFLAAFCFALKGILIKLAYEYQIDAITLLTLRMLFSLPFYIAITFHFLWRLPSVKLKARQWVALALLGSTGYYLASYFNFLGLQYITASLERILLFVYPTFVLLLNVLLSGRRISRLQVFALFLTYAGIMLAFLENLHSSGQQNIYLGAFWVILSGLVYAVYLVGSDVMIGRLGTQRFTCYALIAATFPLVIHTYLHNGLQLSHFPQPVYTLSALMAVVVTVIPTFMMSEGIKRVGSGNASIIASIGPIFTIFLATTVLDESISIFQILGTLLVLAGVFLISWKGKR